MKALAAVSIRQYEQAVLSLSDYYRTVELGLHVVLRDMPPPPPMANPGSDEQIAAVIFGSDHGLCGRFNEDMADYARERLAEAVGNGMPPRLLAVGARVATLLENYFPAFKFNPLHDFSATDQLVGIKLIKYWDLSQH